MIGYKVAVGVSEKHGFFPVMIELEIPKDATIITPLFGVQLFNKNGDLDVVPKYRTNTCKVIKIYPLYEKSYDDWNGNAFSVYELINLYDIITVYKVGNTVSVKHVDEDVKHDCGNGIHFFGSSDEAERFYSNDASQWVHSIVSKLNGTVVSFGESGVLCLCRHAIKKKCLSFE